MSNPTTETMQNIPASKCCQAPTVVQGDETKFYTCLKCGRACDLWVKPTSAETSPTQTWETRFRNLQLCKCKNGKPCFDTMFVIKSFIREEIKAERERILKLLPEERDVEDAGNEPPTDPLLAADQAVNWLVRKIKKALEESTL